MKDRFKARIAESAGVFSAENELRSQLPDLPASCYADLFSALLKHADTPNQVLNGRFQPALEDLAITRVADINATCAMFSAKLSHAVVFFTVDTEAMEVNIIHVAPKVAAQAVGEAERSPASMLALARLEQLRS